MVIKLLNAAMAGLAVVTLLMNSGFAEKTFHLLVLLVIFLHFQNQVVHRIATCNVDIVIDDRHQQPIGDRHHHPKEGRMDTRSCRSDEGCMQCYQCYASDDGEDLFFGRCMSVSVDLGIVLGNGGSFECDFLSVDVSL